jgi:hypothetical protein
MRTRFVRWLLVGSLLLPTCVAAQGLKCERISGGLWPFGSLHGWCIALRKGLCAIGY